MNDYVQGKQDAQSELLPNLEALSRKNGVLTAAIESALPFLIESRDMLYESECLEDGTVPCDQAKRELNRIDKVVNACQACVQTGQD